MSYVRFNDQHDDGQLTQFRERLAAEVRVQTGEEFPIFQDRNDIAWGQAWQQRIDETLDAVTLLVAIITPSFFRSPACRKEVERFLERERKLGRQDLILPVYYVSTPELDDPGRRDADELAQVLASRQFADWRELRFESFTSPAVRKTLAQLATRMRDTFWHMPTEVSSRLSEPLPVTGSKPAATDVVAITKVTAKTEPPTHVVDAYQRGEFCTVAEAIKASKPGDRILVRPGLYEEGLVIDKPLEILGDGPVEDIELKVRDADVIAFQANIGRIANLTLRQIGGEGFNAVDITQGRLDLEGCDISSESLACVYIRNGADPRLRRNRIHDGAFEGVLVSDEGRGTLEDNEIYGNGDDGVAVMEGANPTLRRNQIHDGESYGVNVLQGGLGTFEDNDISANGRSGVLVKDGSSPIMRRNQIHDNNGGGIYVYNHGLGTFEDNDVSGNALSGVLVKTRGNPTMRGNHIHDNRQSGVYVFESARGTFVGNDIIGNALYGLSVTTGGKPTLRRNRINRNSLQAVQIHDNESGGIFEDNDLTDNRGGSWSIADGCKGNVTRKRNRERTTAITK